MYPASLLTLVAESCYPCGVIRKIIEKILPDKKRSIHSYCSDIRICRCNLSRFRFCLMRSHISQGPPAGFSQSSLLFQQPRLMKPFFGCRVLVFGKACPCVHRQGRSVLPCQLISIILYLHHHRAPSSVKTDSTFCRHFGRQGR